MKLPENHEKHENHQELNKTIKNGDNPQAKPSVLKPGFVKTAIPTREILKTV